ncbi:surface lipoprotein assembly modifier [Lonepinella sp. BR2904]|uniref:surface lipoprotein assembly modifier n=1 Tax=Lonepinella sp. BR2904 TaxID=3434551 RepID=UPI003F6DAA07
MKKYLLLLLFSPTLWAEIAPTEIYFPTVTPLNMAKDENDVASTMNVTMARKKLLQDQQSTYYLLNQTIDVNDFPKIAFLLPIYQSFPHQDEILVLFAQGKLAAANQNYAESIDYYQQILVKQPKLNPVRIELAKSLYFNKQYRQAEMEFNQVKTEKLPKQIHQLVDHYLQRIDFSQQWKMDVGLSFLNDRNINNVANNRHIENTGFIKNDEMMPKSEQGVATWLNISRNKNIDGHHFVLFENELFSKYYWTNKDYNDVNNRVSLGYQYQDVKQQWYISPFFDNRWYSNKRYNQALGVKLNYQRWINPSWQVATYFEHSDPHYREYQELNGKVDFISLSLLWLQNPTQYFSFGLSANREKTQTAYYGSNTYSARLGWVKYWPTSWASNISFIYSQRKFHDMARFGQLLPLGKTREDKQYQIKLTLWKNDWSILGLTPKVAFSWKKNDSNLPSLYSYHKNEVNLLFEKSFR